jgi:hypothetical protein
MATSSITGIGDVERRALIASGLRAALSTGALLAVYCLFPISIHHHGRGLVNDVGAMLRLGVAIAIFVVVLSLEIRSITKAKHPMLRAGVAMAVIIPLFLLAFAWIYLTLSNSNPSMFGSRMDRTTALYFTVTIFSTVGFGDITPHTDMARAVTTVQMLSDLVVLAVVVRLILGAATRTTAELGQDASTDTAGAEVPPAAGSSPSA